MASGLRVLSPSRLASVASIADDAAEQQWSAALAPPDRLAPPLISLLDDWSEFAHRDYRSLLRDIFDSQGRIDSEWTEQDPSDDASAAEFYDKTETLIPLLLWWHGTDLNSARCASGAAAALKAIGGHHVLDFGCGIGSTALALTHAGAQVVLADVAEEPLRFADWRLRQRGHEARTMALRKQSLDELHSGWADAIVAFDVFEHLLDAPAALSDLDRVLAQAGIICLNQAYVPEDDELQHLPQRGEVLLWLHQHGYRLAHVPSVCWVAQKARLTGPAHFAQKLSLNARIAASHVLDGQPGAIRRRIGFHVVRQALR